MAGAAAKGTFLRAQRPDVEGRRIAFSRLTAMHEVYLAIRLFWDSYFGDDRRQPSWFTAAHTVSRRRSIAALDLPRTLFTFVGTLQGSCSLGGNSSLKEPFEACFGPADIDMRVGFAFRSWNKRCVPLWMVLPPQGKRNAACAGSSGCVTVDNTAYGQGIHNRSPSSPHFSRSWR